MKQLNLKIYEAPTLKLLSIVDTGAGSTLKVTKNSGNVDNGNPTNTTNTQTRF